MFLKLTLVGDIKEQENPIMVNTDSITCYADVFEYDCITDVETKRTIVNKEFKYCRINFNNGNNGDYLYVKETLEEINLKMAQLERRNNDKSNRKG